MFSTFKKPTAAETRIRAIISRPMFVYAAEQAIKSRRVDKMTEPNSSPTMAKRNIVSCQDIVAVAAAFPRRSVCRERKTNEALTTSTDIPHQRWCGFVGWVRGFSPLLCVLLVGGSNPSCCIIES
jgi:hypothetical protein